MDASINSVTVGRGSGNRDTNVAVGNSALNVNTTGTTNTAIGAYALVANTSGYDNTAIGFNALALNTISYGNTAVGRNALLKTTNFENTAIGTFALTNNIIGRSNVAIGYNAGKSMSDSYNTFVGYIAGEFMTTGPGNTIVGSNCGVNLTSGSYNTLIGYGAATTTNPASHQVILGDVTVQLLYCQVALTHPSDARYKENIEPLDAGLNFINEINTVRFDWKKRGDEQEGRKDIGFTAQDLLEVQEKTNITIPNLVNTSNPNKYCIMDSQLIPILVKAVQELSERVKILEQNR
jgi:hypothetical protein